jgi:hypothetical protein
VPTKHRRVSVSVDDPLAEALERARELRDEGPARVADASLIRELAIDGAKQLERSSTERRRLLEELADPRWTAAHLDPQALGEVLALRDAGPLDDIDG